MEGCESCRLVARRDAGEAPYWDSFFRADAFDVVHALNTSLPGWMVIVALVLTPVAIAEGRVIAETLFNNTDTISGEVFNVAAEVLKNSDSFKLNLSDDFENFTSLSDGYQLTHDGDNSYFINGDNKAVVFPNKNVPIGQRVALIVEPYQK